MIYRKIDENGDYVFGGNSNNFYTGAAAVAQAILTRLRLLLAEWWEGQEDGLPLFERILGQRNREMAQKTILDRISKTPHVITVTSYNFEWNNEARSMILHATVETEYGQVTIEEEMS